MNAIVSDGLGGVRIATVPAPKIERPTDAIVRMTACAVSGPDVRMSRCRNAGLPAGSVIGHEGVGVVEAVGRGVRSVKPGDRVVVVSNSGSPDGPRSASAHFACEPGTRPTGRESGTLLFRDIFPLVSREPGDGRVGLQAEYARIPNAAASLVLLPDDVTDDQGVLLSSVFPTGYFAAEAAEIASGDAVAVFGCGPVGLFAILSAKLLGANQVFAVDAVPDRLDLAAALGAESINFDNEDPVERLGKATNGVGVKRAIDTGDHPIESLRWAASALTCGGTLSVLPTPMDGIRRFPIGIARAKGLTVHAGYCPPRRYVPLLIDLVRSGAADPTQVLPVGSAVELADAYRAFADSLIEWVRVEPRPVDRRHAQPRQPRHGGRWTQLARFFRHAIGVPSA